MRKLFRIHPVEAPLLFLKSLVGWGLLSGAVVVAALGKFLLGGLLAALAALIFLRLKRRRFANTVHALALNRTCRGKPHQSSDFCVRPMKKAALFLSAAIVVVQWLLVGGFIAHSYMWWMKANDFQITAGVSGTIAMTVAAAAASVYSAYSYVTAQPSAVWLRVSSLLVLCAGLVGQLVFWGMALSGVIILVHR